LARLDKFSVMELLRKMVYGHYSVRSEYVIYAHMLEQPIYQALRRPSIEDVNGFMVVGELIHQGLAKLVGGNDEYRRVLYFRENELYGINDKARRFIMRGNQGYYVVVSGSPDAVINGVPIELKTTRSNNVRLYWKWKHRIKIYNWLMNAPYGYVVVINVNDGSEKIFRVDERFSTEEMAQIVLEWMRGRYPSWSLDHNSRVFSKSSSSPHKSRSGEAHARPTY